MALFKTTVKESKREKGIALIFTLIMLSLLLILALSFALDSMFEQKAAYNSASASSAELMTQSQLQEVLSLVQNESANLSKTTWSRDINYDYTSAALDYHTDQLKEQLMVTGLLDDDNNATAWASDGVNWNYIKNPVDNNRIIGRTAFVIIPDEKIPLPSLVDERVGTTEYPSQNEQNDTEPRIGKYVSEINVRNAIPATVAAHTTAEIDTLALVLNWKQNLMTGAGFAGGEYNGSWSSFDSLFDSITSSPNKVNNFTSADQDEFQTNLTISRADEGEAFWMDINDNDKVDDGELYRRFDLTRTDWSKTTHADDLTFLREQLLLDPSGTGTPTEAMQQWDESDGTTVTKGLPWLALFGYKTDGSLDALQGSFPSVYARRCQIAANLKDYCDDDEDTLTNKVIRSTSDKDPAKWLTEEPTFTGNEKTPYINKVGVSVEITRSDSASGSPITATANFVIKPWIELLNIYNSDFSVTNDLRVRVKGSVTASATGFLGSKSDTFYFDEDIDLFGQWNGAARSYSNLLDGNLITPTPSIDVYWDSTVGLDVNIEKVIIEKVILYKGDEGTSYLAYDYVKQLKDSTSISSAFNGLSGAGNATTSWFGWAVHDPRQNLNKDDWEALTPSNTNNPCNVMSLTWLGTASDPYVGKPNCQNNTYYGGGGDTDYPNNGSPLTFVAGKFMGDEEASEDPATLSTSFIRNAPMESPWELGLIHRGAKWQTINLKKYYPARSYQPMSAQISGNDYIAGGSLYYYGDANILDQIKMTHDATSPQKINLNSTTDITFRALLGKLKYNCDIGDMSVSSMAGITPSSGTELGRGDTATNEIATNIKDKYNPVTTSVPENERQTRASLVDMLRLPMTLPSGTINADNDATQEELIGKVVNLTKMGNQAGHFTIVVVSQTIKDIGGISTGIPITKYSLDGTQVATKTDCKIGTFDANIDSTDSNKSIYFDEITATKKIIFKGRTLGANKIKILGLRYAN